MHQSFPLPVEHAMESEERFAVDGDLGHESQMVLFRFDIIVDVERCETLHFSYLTKNFFVFLG